MTAGTEGTQSPSVKWEYYTFSPIKSMRSTALARLPMAFPEIFFLKSSCLGRSALVSCRKVCLGPNLLNFFPNTSYHSLPPHPTPPPNTHRIRLNQDSFHSSTLLLKLSMNSVTSREQGEEAQLALQVDTQKGVQ